MDIKKAINRFEDSAKRQGEATESGEYDVSNSCYDEIVDAYEFLKAEKALENISTLLLSPSVGVRLWAAFYLLPVDENRSLSILEEIEKGDGIHSLTAQTTISEWKKGNLTI